MERQIKKSSNSYCKKPLHGLLYRLLCISSAIQFCTITVFGSGWLTNAPPTQAPVSPIEVGGISSTEAVQGANQVAITEGNGLGIINIDLAFNMGRTDKPISDFINGVDAHKDNFKKQTTDNASGSLGTISIDDIDVAYKNLHNQADSDPCAYIAMLESKLGGALGGTGSKAAQVVPKANVVSNVAAIPAGQYTTMGFLQQIGDSYGATPNYNLNTPMAIFSDMVAQNPSLLSKMGDVYDGRSPARLLGICKKLVKCLLIEAENTLNKENTGDTYEG